MATNNITLVWDDPNVIEKGHRVYRSNTPIDIENLPEPLATLEKNSTTFVDEGLTVGDTWYYRVSAFIDGFEMVSGEIEVTVKPNFKVYTTSNDNTTIKFNGDGSTEWISTYHTDNVNDVAADVNDNVFSVGNDNLLIMTDSSNTKIWEYDDYTTNVTAVSVNNADIVYTGDNGGTLKKIDYSGNEVWSIVAHSSKINQVYADYGDVIYTVSNDNTLKRWGSNGLLERSYTFTNTPMSVKTNIFTGDIIVGAGNDVILLDYNFNIITTITEHTGTVNEVVFDKNGFIVSGSLDNTVKKYSLNGDVVYSFNNGVPVLSLTVSESGTVFMAGNDNNLKMINNTGDLVWVTEQHTDTINRVNITRALDLLPGLDLAVDWENLVAPTPHGLTISQIENIMTAPTTTVDEVTASMILEASKPTNISGVYDDTLTNNGE